MRAGTWAVGRATAAFAVCHRLLSPRYRVRYGSESIALFRELAMDAWRARGVWGLGAAFVRAVFDLVRHATGPGAPPPHIPHRNPRRGWRTGIETLAQDLRYGIRSMLRRPGFTAAVLVTLALGVGATTATFSVVHGILTRPLPFPEVDRIYHFASQYRGSRRDDTVSFPDYLDLLADNPAFVHTAAHREWGANLTGVGEAERLTGLEVTGEYFTLWGLAPAVGRLLVPEDDRYGSQRVVVLGYGLWQRRFGGDPSVVGQSIQLNDTSYRVIGVGPAEFANGIPGLGNPMMWRTMRFTGAPADSLPYRGLRTYRAFGRLAPGVSMAQASERLLEISARLEAEYPSTNLGMQGEIDPVRAYWVGDTRPLLVFMGAVAFVLLIAVANVTSLVVARTTDRARELAVRTALGAGRGRIARQLLVETGLVSVAGGGLGLVGAVAITKTLLAQSAGRLPLTTNVALDGVVLLVAVASVTGAALAAGLVAGHLAIGRGIGSSLHGASNSRSGTGRQSLLIRNVLVAAEVTLSILLLVGAGLLVRSFWKLTRVDPGVYTQVAAFRVAPQVESPEAGNAFYRQLFERIGGLPGVSGVASVFPGLPFSGRQACGTLAAEDDPDRFAGEDMCAEVRGITDDYFAVMGIPILRGRNFGPGDTPDSPDVVIVSESTARLLWPGQDPLGKRLTTGFSDTYHEVVGVVNDVKQFSLDEETPPQTYIPHEHWRRSNRFVVVRAAADADMLLPALRNVVATLDPNLPLTQLGTVEEFVAQSLSTQRFYLVLLTTFAGVALTLAMVGIYGVVSYTVRQRQRDMAIRLSLGARAPGVVGLVLRQGLRPVWIGISLGVAGALALTRLMEGLLFGITPTDPSAFAGVISLMATVAVVAVLVPARRIARLDPVEVLRSD